MFNSASAVAQHGGSAHAKSTHLPIADTAGESAPSMQLKLKLPFPAGTTYEVIQGHDGEFTHSGYNQYAWDFGLPENSDVCAAASGRVVRVKQDGTSGGASNEYFNQGNTVIIDHGSGFFSQYLHLAYEGALVKEGELVRAGQVIARSGNTGFSNVAHLHFQVQDALGQSLPVRFMDVPGTGIPRTGQQVTSENDGSGATQYPGESWLPTSVFAGNSITLITQSLPAHLFRRGREYRVRGRFNQTLYKPGRGQQTTGSIRRVAIYFMAADGGAPLMTQVATTDVDGFFEMTFDPAAIRWEQWSESTGQSNLFSLAIAPVNADGTFWSDISVPVCVR